MSQLIKRLNITAHPQLEKSLGYQSQRRWVAWYWEPDIEQAFFTDGETIGTAPSLSWQIFIQHPQVNSDLQPYQLQDTDQNWLLLDRKTRIIYVGDGKLVQNLLEQPESLGLLANLDHKNNPLSDLNYTLSNQFRTLSHSPFLLYLLKLVPISLVATVMTILGLKTWSSLVPKVEQAFTPSPPQQTTPIALNGTCGVGGSDDFSGLNFSSQTDRELHLIGIYEANANHGGNHHPTGIVDININRQDKPIILALSAYEPVEWKLNLEPGVKVEKIILNGYHDQKISGVSGIPIDEYSVKGTGQNLGNFAYQWNSVSTDPLTPPLSTQIQKQTGLPVTSFQGCYRGTQFQIQ